MDGITVDSRKGDWIQTYTGRQFWPLDPRPEDIDIRDIAHALAHKCRYSGHTSQFYSVAEHSVFVSDNVPEDLALWGLLHDAAEAYLPDVPRPLKHEPEMAWFRAVEARIMGAVCDHFGLCRDEPREVSRVDAAILADEMAQLMAPPPAPWNLPEPPVGLRLPCYSPETAEFLFLYRFDRLVSRGPSTETPTGGG